MKTEPRKIGRNKHTKSIIPKHRISMKSGFIRKIPSLKVSKVDNSRWKIVFHLLDQTEKKVQHFLSFPKKTSNSFKGFDVGSIKEFLPVKAPALSEASVLDKKVLLCENRAKRSSKLISNFGAISSTSHERFPSSRYLRERPARDILTEFYRNAFFNYKNQIGAIFKKCVICSERISSRLLKGKGSHIQKSNKFTNKSKVGKSITHYGTIGARAVKFSGIKRPKNTKPSIKPKKTNKNTLLKKGPLHSKKCEAFPLSSEYSVKSCGLGNRDFKLIFKKISPSLLSERSVTHAGSNENRQSQHRHVEKTPSKMPNDGGGGSLESAFMYKIPSIKISKADGNIWRVIQNRPLDQSALDMEEFLGFPEKESNTFTRFGADSKNKFSSVKVQTLLDTSVLDKKVLSSENIEKQLSKFISNFDRISSTSHVQSPSNRHLRERPARDTLTEFYGSDFCDIKIPIDVTLKRCVVALERVPSLPSEDRRIGTQVFGTFNTKPISSKSGKSSSYGLCDKSAMSEFSSVTRPKHTVSLFKLSNKSERINLDEKPVSFKQSIPLPLSSENSAQQSNKNSKILFKDSPFLNLSEKLGTDAGFTDSRQSQNIEKSKRTLSIKPDDGNTIKSPFVYKIPSITISKAEDNIWRVLQHRPSDPAVSGLEGFLPFFESKSNTYEEYGVASVNEVSFERVPKVLAALGLGRKVVPRENVEERSLKLTSSLDNEASNKGKESHRQSAGRHSYERSDRDLKTENYNNNNKTPNEVTPPSKRKSVPSLSKKDIYLERRNSSKIKSALEMHNMNPKTSKIINDSKSGREMDEILATMFFWRA